MNKLKGTIKDPKEVSGKEIESMLALMQKYYDGVTATKFEKDLDEKKWILVLRDSREDIIRGFTTITLMECVVDGTAYSAIYSGDTVIEKDFRGQSELARVWLNFTLNLKKEGGYAKLFWYLISKGYKTYMLLPLFFKDYYPRFDRPTPDKARLMIDSFSLAKFPGEYDRERGVISHVDGDRLSNAKEEMTQIKLSDPRIRFFYESNPYFWRGDDLACLTEINLNNISKYGLKLIK